MNAMNKVAEVLEMLKPAMEAGCEFTVSMDGSATVIDLNTRAKSECKLYVTEDKVEAHSRYGDVDVIDGFEDVLLAVSCCGYGRPYFDEAWVRVLTENGYSDPRA